MKELKDNKRDAGYVISGCGLSGMITALAFAYHGISTTIIEAKLIDSDGFFDDIRTTALTAFAKDFFEKIGIWSSICEIAGPINEIYVVDNKSPEMIHFSSSSALEKGKVGELMGYLVENSQFKKRLYELVRGSKFITILDGTNYGEIVNLENECRINLTNGNALQAKLFIICEGGRSKAKYDFFSNGISEDYKQTAVTFIVQHEKDHEGTAVEHFMPSGPFAILPLKDSNKSSIVWTLPQESALLMTKLPLQEFSFLVQENFGPFLGEVKIVGEIACFPLKASAVRRYYNKRIVLVADSAHVVHPLAGQGLNQGIKDIDCLTRLISCHSRVGGNLDYRIILKEYQRLRKGDNENMLFLTSAINDVFSSDSKMLFNARQIGFKAIEKISPFKKLIVKYAMGRR